MNKQQVFEWHQANPDWPHHSLSQFIQADAITWHVQILGPAQAPEIMLVHGTGASTHSWAELAEKLAKRWRVVMMDLPGHGFTAPASSSACSLPGMAAGLTELITTLNLKPTLVVGHSAGAAILAQMCLNQSISPNALVSFNGAFLPFGGASGKVFSHVAKVFSSTDLVPWFFSRQAKQGKSVQRLISQTGSNIPPQSADCYQTLLRSQSHVGGALRMMANWDLHSLNKNLTRLQVPLHLVACTQDSTVPVEQAHQIHRRLENSHLHELQWLGHLGHEERPDLHHDLLQKISEFPNGMPAESWLDRSV